MTATRKTTAERHNTVTIHGVPYTLVDVVDGVRIYRPGPWWVNSAKLNVGVVLCFVACAAAGMMSGYDDMIILIGLTPFFLWIAVLAVLQEHYTKRAAANEREADDV